MATEEVSRSLRATDVDEVRAFLDPRFYDSSLMPVGPATGLSARLSVTGFPGLTICDVTFGADLFVSFAELDCYHVNVPVSGALHTGLGRRGEGRVVTPGSLAVYQPRTGEVRDRWSAGCRTIGVKIQAGLLQRELTAMLGGPPPGPLRFGPAAGAGPGALTSWLRLVRWLHTDAAEAGGLATHPLLGGGVQESLVRGLLAITDHQYREQMDAAARRPVATRAIGRVVEAVRDDPATPHTLSSLARIAGLSPRALQHGFRRDLGTTPMSFLRDIRLARAHDDLRRGEPPWTTVAAVAHRWGFPHLGRFSQLYRSRYGVAPSVTLRG